jgi:hypothetical protein
MAGCGNRGIRSVSLSDLSTVHSTTKRYTRCRSREEGIEWLATRIATGQDASFV